MSKRHGPSIGFDDRGRDLEITIRIGKDGRVYFHDITLDMIAVARSLRPDDRQLQERAQSALQMWDLAE